MPFIVIASSFSALSVLVGQWEGYLVYKKSSAIIPKIRLSDCGLTLEKTTG